MKSLLISDIHCSYKVLSSIYELLSNNEFISSIIFSGDLVDAGEPVSFAEEFIWSVKKTGKKFFWVPGNNDFGRAYHKLNAKYKSLEGKVVEFSGRKFTGVGGSPASWSGQYQGERSVDKKEIAGTIFVSHVPPPGVYNFYKSDTIDIQSPMDGQEDKKLKLSDCPLVHICGHIHHTWGVAQLGLTKVIKLAGGYLGYYAIIDLDSLNVKFERFWK